jgi:hypothetical protein
MQCQRWYISMAVINKDYIRGASNAQLTNILYESLADLFIFSLTTLEKNL